MFLSPIPTIQAAEGDDIMLTCLVENLGSHKVSWYRAGSGELLSFDTRMLTSDARVHSEHSRPSSWQLRVSRVRISDAGLYACVVDSTPRLSQLGALEVRPLVEDKRTSAVPFPMLRRGQVPLPRGNSTEDDESRKGENIASCRSSQKRKVAWLNVDKQTLLALHTHVIVRNERIRVSHAGHRVWQLEIRDVRPDDTGYYMCQVNTRPMKNQVGYLNVVVAPYFVDSFGPRNLTARENSNVSFRCEASGNPEPKVSWRREDAQPFRVADQKVTVYRGQELFFKRVSRSHMGAYLCLASNGVPPSISRRIFLEVTFTPMIWVPNQVVGAPLGSNVVLECHTEAHPPSENFWFRSSHRLDSTTTNITSATANDLRAKQKKSKRHEAYITRTGLKVYMKLSIKNLRKEDYGTYHCMAQNALDKTEGKIQLHDTIVKSNIACSVRQNRNRSATGKNGTFDRDFYYYVFVRKKPSEPQALPAASGEKLGLVHQASRQESQIRAQRGAERSFCGRKERAAAASTGGSWKRKEGVSTWLDPRSAPCDSPFPVRQRCFQFDGFRPAAPREDIAGRVPPGMLFDYLLVDPQPLIVLRLAPVVTRAIWYRLREVVLTGHTGSLQATPSLESRTLTKHRAVGLYSISKMAFTTRSLPKDKKAGVPVPPQELRRQPAWVFWLLICGFCRYGRP
ncbi:hypothetical protein HPB50_008293 [Hyalomma asiaticum]|uniref:Uncharacterized protein n=1 Tax=Hyalomma asiaticum TaxID=266040 RepID=A0ACB7SW77_HYAAI|nr:hypothetical protein HPB50_008293 [Hyalomma asiaticum]